MEDNEIKDKCLLEKNIPECRVANFKDVAQMCPGVYRIFIYTEFRRTNKPYVS